MARPKRTPEYHEGPDAARNFRRTMDRILSAGRPSPTVIEDTRVTDRVTVEIETPPKKRSRKRST
jgi:hypothetical protein